MLHFGRLLPQVPTAILRPIAGRFTGATAGATLSDLKRVVAHEHRTRPHGTYGKRSRHARFGKFRSEATPSRLALGPIVRRATATHGDCPGDAAYGVSWRIRLGPPRSLTLRRRTSTRPYERTLASLHASHGRRLYQRRTRRGAGRRSRPDRTRRHPPNRFLRPSISTTSRTTAASKKSLSWTWKARHAQGSTPSTLQSAAARARIDVAPRHPRGRRPPPRSEDSRRRTPAHRHRPAL